jgi:hypothetical protein
MLLFRGDDFWNDTEPGRFWFDGLRARSFAKGDPAYIKKEGLLKAILQHIHHPTTADKNYYQATDFISFSRDKARSTMFARGVKNSVMAPCTHPYQETRYIFTMNIPDGDLVCIGDGLYTFSFRCNLTLKKANSASPMDGAIQHYDTCHLCQVGPRHSILLVNTVEYLLQHREEEKVKDALGLATTDAEWLIFPNDPLVPVGRSSTIPRADFWTAEIFSVAGESRDPMRYAMMGIIL